MKQRTEFSNVTSFTGMKYYQAVKWNAHIGVNYRKNVVLTFRNTHYQCYYVLNLDGVS